MTTNIIPILLTLYIALAVISALGKDFFIDLVLPFESQSNHFKAWSIYLLFPSDLSTLATQQKAVQKDILKTSAELRSTSSQDEFAKWARLNRQHDKQVQQLQTLNSKIEGHKAKFRRVTGIGFWLGTTGSKGVVQWWFSKQPVFWLPVGAFPGWVEYVVSFPKAPTGIFLRSVYD